MPLELLVFRFLKVDCTCRFYSPWDKLVRDVMYGGTWLSRQIDSKPRLFSVTGSCVVDHTLIGSEPRSCKDTWPEVRFFGLTDGQKMTDIRTRYKSSDNTNV